MKISSKLLFTLFLSAFLFVGFFQKSFAVESQDNAYKGVVQVIGYENLYGKMPRMIGWGSATMIDKNGHLLTNNHVVDNGFGGTLDGFVICVSRTVNERPDCHYTASLVARDVEKDIALLRINETDIFGNKVNMDSFDTLPLAYDYIPNVQDEAVAIGFPWVGADTVTQTVGVVAGTQEYNNVTYVKTDTLIAGGNSGGPLLHNGEVIGVNTFGLGFEGGLGYALLISDAQSFIEENIGNEVTLGFDLADFHDYLEDLEVINTSESLNDAFFSIDLSDGYRLTEYEPNELVVSYQVLPDQTNIQAFMMQRFRTPTLDTREEFHYYLQQYGLYSSDREEMKEVTIGGIQMFDIFSEDDPSEGLSYGYKKYVAQLNNNEILFMTIQTPTYNESLFQKAKDKLDSFLSTLEFNPEGPPLLNITSLDLLEPEVSFLAYSENDSPLNRGGRDVGSMWNMRYSVGVLRNYFGNLHENITINVYPQTRDLGRGVSIEELMRTKTQNIVTSEKGLITIRGNEGFYYCQPGGAWMSTVQGNFVDGDLCDAMIVLERGDELPYIIEVKLQTEKKNATKNKELYFDYLENSITLPVSGNGETVVNKTTTSEAIFQDLKDQHPYFLNVVNQLVKNKIIIANRPNFEGDMPMTWGDVVKVYLKGIMAVNMDAAAESCGYPVKYSCLFATQTIIVDGEEVTINKMVEDLEIDIEAYASADLLYRFDLIAKLYFAGIKTVPFTQWALDTFESYGEHLYPAEKQQLQDREYTSFGKRRVGLAEAMPTDYRRTPASVYWHPSLGIVTDAGMSMQKIVFGIDYPKYTDFIGSLLAKVCGSNLYCYMRESSKGYYVMTLGGLVNYIYPLMDRSKFMPELEEKKEEGYGYRG